MCCVFTQDYFFWIKSNSLLWLQLITVLTEVVFYNLFVFILDTSRPGHCGEAAEARQWTEGNHPPADHCSRSFGFISDIII